MREIHSTLLQNKGVFFILAIKKQKNIYWEVPVIDETNFV